MKNSIRYALAALIAAGVLSGCSSTVPVDTTAPSESGNTAASSGSSSGVTSGGASDVKTVEVDPLNDPNSPLAARTVYFALDSYAVDSQYDGMLAAHANYLASHKNRSVTIEGNTDERGSSEYNLALGQKRSEAVVQKLKLLGVPADRLEAVSFGKEKPAVQGSGEAAWSKNRRADIRYR